MPNDTCLTVQKPRPASTTCDAPHPSLLGDRTFDRGPVQGLNTEAAKGGRTALAQTVLLVLLSREARGTNSVLEGERMTLELTHSTTIHDSGARGLPQPATQRRLRWLALSMAIGLAMVSTGCGSPDQPEEATSQDEIWGGIAESELVKMIPGYAEAEAEAEASASCTSNISPRPPSSGPGSHVYPHGGMWSWSWQYGPHPINTRYFIYAPTRPKPDRAPVVFYFPGYGASTAGDLVYRDMFRHLARKGYIVVYISYGPLFPATGYESNIVTAMHLARARLNSLPSWLVPRADWSRVAYAGHSLGTILGARIANRANEYGVPRPKALIFHDSEGTDAPTIPQVLPINDLSGIHPDTLIVFASAETSLSNGSTNRTVGKIWRSSPQVPNRNKVLLVSLSDDHGCPPLRSNHLGVLSFGTVLPRNAIDWFGYDKPTEAALLYAFEGTHRSYLFGDTFEQKYMGTWRDGVPVLPMLTKHEVAIAAVD